MQVSRLLVLVPFLCQSACFAGGGMGGSMPMGSVTNGPVSTPGYINPNPYNSVPVYVPPYGGGQYIYQRGQYPYYRSPYNYVAPFGYSGGVSGFQPYGADLYSLSYSGSRLNLWRSQSGYYYPWVPGYNYNNFPIFVVPTGQSTPQAVLPPISVLVSDLNDYLDKAKEKGKVSEPDYISLKRRASDILNKEHSIAYEGGGTLDPDQESEIRRDVEGLSGEVARRVRP
jgi:hypothetical protein